MFQNTDVRPVLAPVSWPRMIRAVEKIRERMLRAARALEGANVPYAVIGGNAVAAWVSRVDEAAVRNTRDVDLLLRADDLPRARLALESAGFVYRHAAGVDLFLDGPEAKARDAVHVILAGEKVRPEYLHAAPDVAETDTSGAFRLIELAALVRMKLTSFRDRDRMHLRDLVDVGLVDGSWLTRIPIDLAERLRMILES